MAERRLKHWGWGYEDQQPSHDEVVAAAEGIRAHLGFGDGRGGAPGGAGGRGAAGAADRAARTGWTAPVDPHARASHALGKAYRDVVRGFRGEFAEPPDVVARPRDEADVERWLSWCADADAVAIPFGGGTSVVGGVEARGIDRPVVSLDLRGLDRVVEVDRDVARGAHPGRRDRAGARGAAQGARAHAAPLPAVVRVLHARRLDRHPGGRALRHAVDAHRRPRGVGARDHAVGRLGEPPAARLGARARAPTGC